MQALMSSGRLLLNLVLTIAFVGIAIALMTVFFYPTARTLELRTVDDWNVVASRNDVRLSPIFGFEDEKMYTIQLVSSAEQELREYAASYPEPENLSLVTPFFLNAYGHRSEYTAFSQHYWVRVCLLPGMVLGVVAGLIMLKWRKQE